MWTKHVIYKQGFPIKVYVNEDNTRAVMFFCFGRYSTLRSDVSALDFAISIIFHKGNNGVLTFEAYNISMEDTAIIKIAS